MGGVGGGQRWQYVTSVGFNLANVFTSYDGVMGFALEVMGSNNYEVMGLDNFSKYGKINKSYDNHPNYQLIKGDVFFALCLARLLENKCGTFNGPFGAMYLDAWRKSYTQKLGPDATCEDIAKFAQSHSTDQMEGLQKPVKGKLFEIMESQHENADGDEWTTEIHESPNHPMVDLKWTNNISGKSYGVQYKASSNINYIEGTIERYPDTPIIVPKGVAEKVNHPMVSDGVYGPETLKEINEENFNKKLTRKEVLDKRRKK